jgi:hypothetical protein
MSSDLLLHIKRLSKVTHVEGLEVCEKKERQAEAEGREKKERQAEAEGRRQQESDMHDSCHWQGQKRARRNCAQWPNGKALLTAAM